MNENSLLTLERICRFRAVTLDQLKAMTQPYVTKSTFFAVKSYLETHSYINRIFLPEHRTWVCAPTQKGLERVYPDDYRPSLDKLREIDLVHQVSVTESLWQLACHEQVTGLAVEHELNPKTLARFSHGRRPDGIIRLGYGADAFEVAVEVEFSLKSKDRIEEILSRYERTIQNQYHCKGVIFVILSPTAYKTYTAARANLDPAVLPAIRLLDDKRVQNLDPNVYGARRNQPGFDLGLIRTETDGAIEYSSMRSTFQVRSDDDPLVDQWGQSGIADHKGSL